tara:strand:- start:1011 stop:1313 length:303 start_codon:yes stop_codon:yes gene_type:complete
MITTTKSMTLKYANEVVNNLLGGHGPDTESAEAYAHDLQVSLPCINEWLLQKMNDNYLRWSAEIISADVYEDTMTKYSDLATLIIDNTIHWDYYSKKFLK